MRAKPPTTPLCIQRYLPTMNGWPAGERGVYVTVCQTGEEGSRVNRGEDARKNVRLGLGLIPAYRCICTLPGHVTSPAPASQFCSLTGMPGYAALTWANMSGEMILLARRERFSLFLRAGGRGEGGEQRERFSLFLRRRQGGGR